MAEKNRIDFKWRPFQGELILQCVCWYCKYSISDRDLADLMLEHDLSVDHITVYRWV